MQTTIDTRLSDEHKKLADETRKRTRENFEQFVKAQRLKQREVVDAFYPYIGDESRVSKILKGDRDVPIEVLVLLHCIYGVDLNEFIAGDAHKPAMTPEIEDAILALADGIRKSRFNKK